MGLYLNPTSESREQFLEREGMEVPFKDFTLENLPSDCLGVVWMDSGAFRAVAVAYDIKEFEYWRQLHGSKEDPRPKKYYFVGQDALRAACPEYADYVR